VGGSGWRRGGRSGRGDLLRKVYREVEMDEGGRGREGGERGSGGGVRMGGGEKQTQGKE